jgi:spermidine/putrescine transport system substrate-binding protein
MRISLRHTFAACWQALLLALTGGPVAAAEAPPAPARELVFLNWADYVDPDLVREFEARANARVKMVYFEGDEAREGLLAKSQGRGYDLVVINGPLLEAYRRLGWLAPLTPAEVPNLEHIDPRWLDAYPARGWAVPYTWGTTGIAYRSDLVDRPITTWRQFFHPSDALRGKISLIKASRDVVGMALKALGHSLNSEVPAELDAAEALLRAQRPFVRTYSYVDLDERSELVTGEVAVAMMYNGDALMVREHEPRIAYALPEEGGAIWVDYLAVLQASPNQRLAAELINFLNEPDNAARLAQFLYYATPNRAAEQRLPQEFLADPTIYPSAAALQRSEFAKTLAPRATQRYNRIFDALTR